MHITNPIVDKLVAELAAIDQKRAAIYEEARVVKTQLNETLYAEQAAIWGLTPDEYRAATKPKTDRLKAESDLHAANVQIIKLKAKVNNPKYTEAQRAEFTTAAKAIEDSLPAIKAAIHTASYDPLSVLLQRARVAKGLGVKEVQTGRTTATGTR